ncbi:hypothetical protein FB645_002186 [Coemansia sp. IMI 203386]|nr:hypothetical protein FB645_002186 [Coemansia sp. IMI 203386]
MPFLDYVIISTQTLCRVLVIGATGYAIALKKTELKALARVNIALLTPALLFTKITKSLDRQMLLELWFVPIMYVLLGFVGLFWTQYGGRVLGLPMGFNRLCMLAVYFSNVNSILIPMVKGIASSPDSEFLLRDKNDTPMAMADRAIAYGMLLGIMNNLLRWSVGVAIMKPPVLSSTGSASNASMATLEIGDASQNETAAVSEATQLLAASQSPQCSTRNVSAPFLKTASKRIWQAVRPCMTPPLCSVLVAVFVVCIPSLQHAMLEKGTYAFSVWSAFDICGEACVPLTLLALGGQLSVDRHAQTDGHDDGHLVEHVPNEKQNAGVVLVLLGRFLVVPIFSCAVLYGIHQYASWLIPLLRNDPALFLTLAIVSATPPAVNLLTVAQQLGMYETEAARILSTAYFAGIFVLSIEVSVFLWLASLIHA